MSNEPMAEWERDLLTKHDVEVVLAEHVLTSGFDEAGVYWKYACGCSWTGDSDASFRTHVADALAPVIAQARREGAAEALREAADALDALLTHTAARLGREYRPETPTWLRERAAALRGDA